MEGEKNVLEHIFSVRVKNMNLPVLWDVEWVTGVVIVASNLLHVENSQDPVKIK